MGETKIDRRRRYTLSVIQEAFFALPAEVGFAKMTVADICRRAEINRGTFYLHYEDKYALLDALIDEALAAAPPLGGCSYSFVNWEMLSVRPNRGMLTPSH